MGDKQFDRHEFAWGLVVKESQDKAAVDDADADFGDYRDVLDEGTELSLDVAYSALLDQERERKRFVSLAKALTDNDRCILLAMDQMQANAINPQGGYEIVVAAIGRGDHKKAFKRVKENCLVGSRPAGGGGYWLTELGQHVVEAIKKTNSHTD